MITIRRVDDARGIREALDLPYRLYEGDPCWVPPLRRIESRRAEGFRARGDLVMFLAERGGRVVGSISVLDDPGYRRSKGEDVAWFGWFECEDDPEIARALLDAARTRARELGCTTIRGPRNLTRFEYVGITVEGHDTLPPFMQGHHPRSYQRLLKGEGLHKHHDVLAYDISLWDEGRPRATPDVLLEKAAACDLPGLEVRAARRRSMRRDLIDAHTVLNSAFTTVPDVSPMPRSVWMSLGRTYLTVADPRLLQIAHQAGRPVGFAACFPELNEALVKVRGRLLPLGWWRLARGLRRVRTASFKLIGVVPDLRGSGLHAVMVNAVIDGVRAAGYDRIEASVIDERNAPMRAVVEGAGMGIYRRYRFFEGAV
ncbi:MAG: GNAT family N-acetyltransferase [Alphaproteobacteria bacterium]|nr:GNAT family N-acetyltransferase [Alphaproteobacteria bacterium]MCB9695445.1 GNAT family N-acetyltransferase [Alphaproteobacteria bacterium]